MAFHKFIESQLAGAPIDVLGNGSQSRDFTYVGDAVRATLAAADAHPGNGYNVGTGTAVTLRSAIGMIERVTGRRAKVVYHPRFKGDVRKTAAGISRARAELGYHPRVKLVEGLRRMFEWQLQERKRHG